MRDQIQILNDKTRNLINQSNNLKKAFFFVMSTFKLEVKPLNLT